ncbi:ABC transporter ATP-binding protein [Actinomycetospora soli]|uniref:ABC transporter ATP-binding protein n=1 Tax=Actinomycetospora soli TaxID=2893887 RepID=UPI001E56316E|nr:ATP-binding cassette domain-containing protein [Actinomycetospora soli]MCD2189631.1 ATP-binding cassette domain-containing protein [Actinomycetospora soli]
MISVEGLRITAGASVLVNDLSFAVRAGRVLALVGESGSGKTSTALALLGEARAGTSVSGAVAVDGSVGYVPQHPGAVLHPVRRVGSVLREIARHHGRPRAAVHEALRRAQVADPDELLGRHRHQLSGGQQQRVVLAQALLGGAQVIVADEPTTGQDTPTRRRVAEELAAVVADGVTLVLCSHDLALVRALADDVVVLRDGVAVEQGPAAEVLGAPRHAYTRALVGADGTSGVSGGPRCAPSVSGGPRLTPEAPLLAATDVTADHRARGRSRRALHGVSLELGPGARVALVGRSGSGKTTLARVLAGLHAPSSGRVELRGEPLAPRLTRRRREQVAAVQYVFQDARASFDEHRPVLAQVARTALLLRGHDDAEARARAMLARVGLDEAVVTRPPRSLSGGELARAALARALLAEPDVLVCDEVTAGLDTLTRAGILDLLDGIGAALLVVTHDPAVVTRLADEVVVLDDGRVVERGPAAQVLADPREDLTRALLGSPVPTPTR